MRHTKAYTEDKVDFRDMRESAANLARILLRMASVDELPFKRKFVEEMRSMLKKYGLDEVMELFVSYPLWFK